MVRTRHHINNTPDKINGFQDSSVIGEYYHVLKSDYDANAISLVADYYNNPSIENGFDWKCNRSKNQRRCLISNPNVKDTCMSTWIEKPVLMRLNGNCKEVSINLTGYTHKEEIIV